MEYCIGNPRKVIEKGNKTSWDRLEGHPEAHHQDIIVK